MEWVPWPWEQSFDGPIGSLSADRRQVAQRPTPGSGAGSSDLDTWLMALVYRTIAAASWCEICGARFAPRLRLLPAPVGTQRHRQFLVVAKCRGWRHHVHVASVDVSEDRDIALRPLRATD
jgi:hypothetical protein